MNLKEFDEFSLADAVSFHDELNPAIFHGDVMMPQVRDQFQAKLKSQLGAHL